MTFGGSFAVFARGGSSRTRPLAFAREPGARPMRRALCSVIPGITCASAGGAEGNRTPDLCSAIRENQTAVDTYGLVNTWF
jgi:hypothetical protein